MFRCSAGLVTAGGEATPWEECAVAAAAAAASARMEEEGGSAPPPPPPPACRACRAQRLHDAPALCDALRRWHRCPELHKAIDGINYIADQTRKEEESTRVSLLVL